MAEDNPFAGAALFPAPAGATVDLQPDSRIVTRQQLADPEFYRAVAADVFAGRVQVLDQGTDSLSIDGQGHRLTAPAAITALAASQQSWVGVPVGNRFSDSLTAGADRVTDTARAWNQATQ